MKKENTGKGLTDDELLFLRAKLQKRQDEFVNIRGGNEIYIGTFVHVEDAVNKRMFKKMNAKMIPAVYFAREKKDSSLMPIKEMDLKIFKNTL